MRQLALTLLAMMTLALTACQQHSRNGTEGSGVHSTLTGTVDRKAQILCHCGENDPIRTEALPGGDGRYHFSVALPYQSLCRLSLLLPERDESVYLLRFTDGKGNSSRQIYLRSNRVDLGTITLSSARTSEDFSQEILLAVDSHDAMLVASSVTGRKVHLSMRGDGRMGGWVDGEKGE